MAAREVLAVTDIIPASPGNPGILVAAVAANNAEFANDGRTILCVLCASDATTITFITQGTVDGNAIADPIMTVTIDAAEVSMFGPFPPGIYNNDEGDIELDISQDTGVTLNPFRLPA